MELIDNFNPYFELNIASSLPIMAHETLFDDMYLTAYEIFLAEIPIAI